MPEITNEDAFSGCSGFIVVLCLLKDKTAVIRVIIPSSKNDTAITSVRIELYFGNRGLERKMPIPHIKVIMGGGILLCI
tara:strand:- start:421 stop:657 length:237 start_codon:yes stop_codon:yes gene_type:complete